MNLFCNKTHRIRRKCKHVKNALFVSVFAMWGTAAFAQSTDFKLNSIGVLKKTGVDLMIYNNSYTGGFFDDKVSGIEMIQHGVRTVNGGAVRLSPTPEQWDLIPTVSNRTINTTDNSVMVTLYYKKFDFTSRLKVEGKGSGFLISVILDTPLPDKLEGKANMNIEFLPSAYFKKTYIMDNQTGIFPLAPTGPVIADPFSEKMPQVNNVLTLERFGDTYAKATPFATGKKLVLAPDDPKSLVVLQSLTGQMGLLDGRNLASNGWLVVSEVLPSGKTGVVVQWMVTPNSIPTWKRDPVIAHSQVGYHPDQQKVAVIELDPNDKPLPNATLYRIGEDGKQVKVLDGKLIVWGNFIRYNYCKFDFSAIKEPGIYRIQYGNVVSDPFPIGKNVYANTWYPTLDVWMPVQMDHMFVKEAYRVWHGNPHQDDALQAPTDTAIHDGYRMGSTTGTKYKSLEHIPGLNIGGWFDAGDFDIQTGSHNTAVGYLVGAWEDLKPMRDQTMVDKERKYVAIHHPDGVPDVLQQIEHGTLALVAQFRAFGHAIRGIVQPNTWQYNMIGDAGNLTDGLIFNPNLKPNEKDGYTSGKRDDRWAFTNMSPSSDIASATALASASRALKSYNEELANECLQIAQKVWDDNIVNKKEDADKQNEQGMPFEFSRSMSGTQEAAFAVEMLLTTGDQKYAEYLTKVWSQIKNGINNANARRYSGNSIVRSMLKAMPYMNEAFKNDMRAQALCMKHQIDSVSKTNPYGVPLGQGGFYGAGSNFSIVDWALTNAKFHQYFPEIIDKESAIRGLNYILGCHPASSISFVSGVGVNSKRVTYGNNRADFTYIPGGMVPGNYLIKPDFYENKEDWPFIWYENEVVVDGCTGYIYLAALVDHILSTSK
ncbi:MAG TPA: glycoside hydrolase family 9 protein [Bacteroidales bacterium]|nr:glycoside hydrolase family 9 protein [Bacteroidales bacterium]